MPDRVPRRTVKAVATAEGVIAAPAHLGLETRAEFRRGAVELVGIQDCDRMGRLEDSAGLGTLILIQQHAAARRQTVRLRGINEELRLLLVLTKLEDQFEIEGRHSR